MDGVYEIVLYRLKPGTDRDHFLQESDRATEWLRSRSGYLTRELLEDDGGQWIDILRWASLEDAQNAAAAFVQAPELAEFMAVLDLESGQMIHARAVSSD